MHYVSVITTCLINWEYRRKFPIKCTQCETAERIIIKHEIIPFLDDISILRAPEWHHPLQLREPSVNTQRDSRDIFTNDDSIGGDIDGDDRRMSPTSQSGRSPSRVIVQHRDLIHDTNS